MPIPVLLDGGPLHQHWTALPRSVDLLLADGGEYRRVDDGWVWVPDPHPVDSAVEHIRPVPGPSSTVKPE